MTLYRKLLKSAVALIAITLSVPAVAQSNPTLSVVATFSILGDITMRIGGEHINLSTLVGPNGDAHVFQPTPADARAVSEANVLFVNGLEFEGWLDRLIDASDFNGAHVVTTAGIIPIAYEEEGEHHEDEAHAENEMEKGEKHEDGEEEEGHEPHHGVYDPHAWQSLKNAIVYADNITTALAKADPVNATHYYQNRAAYIDEVKALEDEIGRIVSELPADRRTVVTSHDAFQYFARDYGLTFLAPQGLSTDSEASAQDVAQLIEQMREERISAVFIENITDSRLLKQIANETGAKIGGTLYPGALSGLDGPASTYLDMIRHNATTLVESLSL